MIFKVQTWPKEEMQGLPFCEVIAKAKNIGNTEPHVVRSSDE